MNFQSSEHILLTGAGFTKNYGTPLANEMWAEMFNHKLIQNQPRIRDLFLNSFDYELIYTSIMEDIYLEYTIEEKNAINEVMKSVYNNIDLILMKYARSDISLAGNLNQFIDIFNEGRIYSEISNNVTKHYKKKTDNKSFIFTLNQDMFFERLCRNSQLSIPGINNKQYWFTSFFKNELSKQDYCILPDDNELNHIKLKNLSEGNFFVIKLHGSCNWKSFDGSEAMVIGRGKNELIQKEPLLKYYFNIFKNVLSQNRRRLLIIGYSFSDEHINQIIAEAVRDYGLKIFIISTESPNNLKSKLENDKNRNEGNNKISEYGKYIWQGISGYFQYKLIDIFPDDSSITQVSKNLKTLFFEKI